MTPMQLYILVLASLPFLFVAWVLGNPLGAVTTVAELKRRFRRSIIQRHGKARAEAVFDKFRKHARKQGYPSALIESVIREHKEKIIQYQGTKYADKFLGTPGPLERDF